MNRQDYRSLEEYKANIRKGWELEDEVIRTLNNSFRLFSDWKLEKQGHDANRIFKSHTEQLSSEPDAAVKYKGTKVFSVEIKVTRAVSNYRFYLKESSVISLSQHDLILVHNKQSNLYTMIPKSLAISLELAIDPYTTKPAYKLTGEHLRALRWVQAYEVEKEFQKHFGSIQEKKAA